MQKTQSDLKLLSILLFLCLVPVLSGGFRLFSISSNGAADLENLKYLSNPVPIAVHMITYMVFCVVGAFQIAPVFRSRHLKLHRLTGRALLPIGFAAVIAGIWMELAHPSAYPGDETIGYVRILFGIGMMVSLIIAVMAIRRRDVWSHKLWMLRSYAIALGPTTQAFVAIPWFAMIGEPKGLPWAAAMFLAWMFNLLVADLYARRADVPAVRTA